jgi:hypothetical protein
MLVLHYQVTFMQIICFDVPVVLYSTCLLQYCSIYIFSTVTLGGVFIHLVSLYSRSLVSISVVLLYSGNRDRFVLASASFDSSSEISVVVKVTDRVRENTNLFMEGTYRVS